MRKKSVVSDGSVIVYSLIGSPDWPFTNKASHKQQTEEQELPQNRFLP